MTARVYAPFPETIDLDGVIDEEEAQVKYFGEATKIEGNRYRCLASCRGVLCLVEVIIQHQPGPLHKGPPQLRLV